MTSPDACGQLGFRDAVELWCAAGATGALRALAPPGGSVYLNQGRITYAESPPVCGVDRLLTASGRLPGEDWRNAVTAGRSERRVGDILVEQGALARVELEAAVLAALYSAALFLMDLQTEVQFEVGAAPLIGPVVTLNLAAVDAEVARRRRVLSNTWPDPRLDGHAVVPRLRLAGQCVTLTSAQWEIVANADRRRTPVELARSLGRDTFATLWEVRRLARAGLVEPGRPRAASRGRPAAAANLADEGAAGSEHGADEGAVGPGDSTGDRAVGSAGGADERAVGSAGGADEGAVGQGSGVAETVPTSGDGAPPPLPRRDAAPAGSRWLSSPPNGATGATSATGAVDACSESTLLRLRDALGALR